MSDIKILASQITDILIETHLPEGRTRLIKYFNHFGTLEGKPVVERIDSENFRLITCYENYNFYNKHKPTFPFVCELKFFSNDHERYLELLKQLFHGKARSSFEDKHDIINKLNRECILQEKSAEKCKK